MLLGNPECREQNKLFIQVGDNGYLVISGLQNNCQFSLCSGSLRSFIKVVFVVSVTSVYVGRSVSLDRLSFMCYIVVLDQIIILIVN